MFIVRSGGFHHEPDRGVHLDELFLGPFQELTEPSLLIREGGGTYEAFFLLVADSSKPYFKVILGDINTNNLFDDIHTVDILLE